MAKAFFYHCALVQFEALVGPEKTFYGRYIRKLDEKYSVVEACGRLEFIQTTRLRPVYGEPPPRKAA